MAAAARRLWQASAAEDGTGLLLRGEEPRAVHVANLAAEDAWRIASRSCVRLGQLSEQVERELRDHPDPAVRRAAALLAARAHPLLEGLDERGGE